MLVPFALACALLVSLAEGFTAVPWTRRTILIRTTQLGDVADMEFSSLGDAVDSVVVKGSNVVEGASTDLDFNAILPFAVGGVALVALVIGLGAILGKKEPPIVGTTPPKVSTLIEKQLEEIDVTIPYDAASRLAFRQAKLSKDYEEFKQLYESKSVAEVIVKKKQREVADLKRIAQSTTKRLQEFV